METQVDDNESKLNYDRINFVVTNLLPEGLRVIFKQEWDSRYSTTLGEWKDEQRNGKDFRNSESRRNQKEYAHLLETMSRGNRAEWDCTMLFYAILDSDCIYSLNPKVKSNVDNLREFLNYFEQVSVESLSCLQFPSAIRRVQCAFQELGLPTLKIDQVKHQKYFFTEESKNVSKEIDALKQELQKMEIQRQERKHVLRNSVGHFCVLPPKPSHEVVRRDMEILKLKQQLEDLRRANKNSLSIVYLMGSCGSGKSVLASCLGEQYFTEVDEDTRAFSFVMTINGESPNTLLESYVSFARLLKCPEDAVTNTSHSKELTTDQKIASLKTLISFIVKLYSSWLLIIDNVTSLASVHDYFPNLGNEQWARGQLLITTQDLASVALSNASVQIVSLSGGMEPHDAFGLLEKLSGITDKEMENQVARVLDYQPLALASAAIYVGFLRQNKKTSNFGWNDFLKKVEENLGITAETNLAESEFSMTMKRSYSAITTLAIDVVMISDKVIHHAFDFLSLCALQLVRLDLVVNYIILNGDIKDRDVVSARLLRCPLLIIEERERDQYIGVHGIVRSAMTAVVEKCIEEDEYFAIFGGALKAFNEFVENSTAHRCIKEIFPHLERVINATENSFRRAIPWSISHCLLAELGKVCQNHDKLLLARKCYQLSLALIRGTDNLNAARAKSLIARVCENLGELNEARSFYKGVLESLLEVFEPQHAEVATAHSCLGSVYHKLCVLQLAREHHERALDIRLQNLGKKHVDVARSYNNLGAVHCDLIDLEKARDYHQKALAICMNSLGPEHVHVATTYNNLGLVFRAMGDHKKAKEYHKLALEIRLKTLGTDHVSVANCYNDLGVVYCALDDLLNGKAYYYRALSIYHNKLGRKHLYVATANKNLGAVYMRLGDLQKAKDHYERAHECFLWLWGPNHAKVAISLNALASVSSKMGEIQRAKSLFERSLAIQREIVVAEDSNLAMTYNGLGLVHSELGEFQKALEYYEQSLAVSRHLSGTSHMDVATIHNSLGLVLHNLGDLEKAKMHCEFALSINSTTLDDEHPNMASVYSNLGILSRSSHRYEESKKFLTRALEIRLKRVGADSVDVAMSYNDLGLTHCEQEHLQQAKLCFEKALSILVEKLGPDNLYVAHTSSNLGFLHSKRREWNEANDYYVRALHSFRNTLGPEHDSVANSYSELARVNQELNRLKLAKEYCEQALAIWQKEPVLFKR